MDFDQLSNMRLGQIIASSSVTSVSVRSFFVVAPLKNIQLSCPCLRNVGLECHLQHSKSRISGIYFQALVREWASTIRVVLPFIFGSQPFWS